MARSRNPEGFRSTLRERRKAAGLTQKDLAARVGLTRQALLKVEAGDFLPNTAVSLRLAEVLGCRVEELFALGGAPPGADVSLVGGARGAGPARVLLGRGAAGWVAYPAAPARPSVAGYGPADALLRPGAAPELLVPLEDLERTALVLGCDPALSLVRAHLGRVAPDHRAHTLPASSTRALEALAEGRAHVAGTHLVTASGAPDLGPARAALAACGGEVVTFAVWDQGLVVAPGNPKGVRGVADLARPDVEVVHRPAGSGSHLLLETLLAREGLAPADLGGAGREVPGHAEVCQAVLLGAADAGVAVASLAEDAGLEFVPLGEVRFDLVIRADAREHPAVRALLELLADARFRRDLGALPSYAIGRTGSVAATVEAA